MDFLRSFLRRHFARKPVGSLRNVGCFLKLGLMLFKCNKRENSFFFLKGNKIHHTQSQNMLTLIFAKTISPLTWQLLMLPGVSRRGAKKDRHFSGKLIKCEFWVEMWSLKGQVHSSAHAHLSKFLFFCRDMWDYASNTIMSNQSAHSPGIHLHLINLNICK